MDAHTATEVQSGLDDMFEALQVDKDDEEVDDDDETLAIEWEDAVKQDISASAQHDTTLASVTTASSGSNTFCSKCHEGEVYFQKQNITSISGKK